MILQLINGDLFETAKMGRRWGEGDGKDGKDGKGWWRIGQAVFATVMMFVLLVIFLFYEISFVYFINTQ